MATRASQSGNDEPDTPNVDDDLDALEGDEPVDGEPVDGEPDDGLVGDDAGDGEVESLDDLDDGIDPAQLDELDDDEIVAAVVSAVTDFDDDDELAVAVDDSEGLDGLRDGEFVCRSCHLARRETQLADAKRLLCRDCV